MDFATLLLIGRGPRARIEFLLPYMDSTGPLRLVEISADPIIGRIRDRPDWDDTTRHGG